MKDPKEIPTGPQADNGLKHAAKPDRVICIHDKIDFCVACASMIRGMRDGDMPRTHTPSMGVEQAEKFRRGYMSEPDPPIRCEIVSAEHQCQNVATECFTRDGSLRWTCLECGHDVENGRYGVDWKRVRSAMSIVLRDLRSERDSLLAALQALYAAGRLHGKCKRCEGERKIQYFQMNGDSPYDESAIDCPDCNGTGYPAAFYSALTISQAALTKAGVK